MSQEKATKTMMESSEDFDENVSFVSDDEDCNDDDDSDEEDDDDEEEDDDDNDGEVDYTPNPVATEPKDMYKENIRKFRDLCGAFVNHEKVQLFVVVLIAINAVMMGVNTFEFRKDIDDAFGLADKIFLSLFTAELLLQTIYHGFRLFLNGWLVFDFVIIFVSWTFNDFGIIRAFRIFRALRLVTRVKVMKNLVLALFSVLPKMGAICLLLFVISYIFAVMFTQLFKGMAEDAGAADDPDFPDYYGRLDRTFFTLFQLMTLDGWSDIARETIEIYQNAWIPIVAFVTISGFIVVNLIIAVICDAVSNMEEDEKAKIHGDYVDDGKPKRLALHDQVAVLQKRVQDLKKLQEQTESTLQYMLRHIKKSSDSGTSLRKIKSKKKSTFRPINIPE